MAAAPERPGDAPRAFRPAIPVVIGLVGGIAAGKSTVAGLFAERGLWHVDADRIAREVSADPAVLQQVREELGARFVADGALDRAALAAEVFREPAIKGRLEAILHPPIRARIRARVAEAKAAGRSALLDVPLLFEGGLFELCDTVVFVAAADDVRRARANARGWADDELQRREQNQLPLDEKRRRAQHVVDNDGELAATRAQVDALLERLEAAA